MSEVLYSVKRKGPADGYLMLPHVPVCYRVGTVLANSNTNLYHVLVLLHFHSTLPLFFCSQVSAAISE